MKKYLLLLVAMVLTSISTMARANVTTITEGLQGDGSKENPFEINNAKDLLWFKQYVDGLLTADDVKGTHPLACARLMDTIDLSTVCHAANEAKEVTEASWSPIGLQADYKGVFDGNNKSITGLYINSTNEYQGLFAKTDGDAVIKDLTVNGNVTTTNNFASLIASYCVGNTVISNCKSYGSVTALSNVSGIACQNSNTASIKDCVNYADISATGDQSSSKKGLVGGISGYAYKVSNCVNRGKVSGYEHVGGIIGQVSGAQNSSVTDCANHGDVTGTGGFYVGGILGDGCNTQRCTNAAKVTSSGNDTGGIAGYYYPSKSHLEDCINLGDVKGGTIAGGICGQMSDSRSNNCFNKGNVEATNFAAGLLFGQYGNDPGYAFYNCYYVNDAKVKVNGVETANQFLGNGAVNTPATPVESADVESGKLALLLESNTATPGTWGQDLENGKIPEIGGKTIYFSGTYQCNGVVLTEALTNDESKKAEVPAHSDEFAAGGFCTVCGESETLHGDGTVDNPYLISSVAQLEWFRDQSNANYSDYSGHAKLVNDIDLAYSSSTAWKPINAVGTYKGTFDGNDHTVKNVFVTYQQNAAGFFGYLGDEAVVTGLTVEGKCDTPASYVGMIAGYSYGATILNCTAKGQVNNTYSYNGTHGAGGIVGYVSVVYNSKEHSVEGCTNYASVTNQKNSNVGGIVGYMDNSCPIKNCTNYGNLSASSNAGGILGSGCNNNDAVFMTNCANYGNVTAAYNDYVGGLAGVLNSGSNNISNCYVGNCEIRGYNGAYAIAFVSQNNTTFSNIVYSKECKVYTSSTATEPATLSDYVAYGDYNTSSELIGVSASQISAGEATYLLNGSVSGGKVWTQDLSKSNGQPILLGDADRYGVYLMGYAHGETERSFSNDAKEKNTLHAEADAEGSHDASFVYSSNSDETHDATCSVCALSIKDEACDMPENVCLKCLYELLGSYTLNDAEAYSRKSAGTVTSLTYTRTFNSTQAEQYNALYVPFAMEYSDWSESADIFKILNIFEEDTDKDNKLDACILKVVKLEEGSKIKANTPYLIKPLSAGEMSITLTNAVLAPAEENSIWCASTDYKFVFTGTYAEKAIADNYYIGEDGSLTAAGAGIMLSPQRWSMSVKDKDSDAVIAPSVFAETSPCAAKGIIIVSDEDQQQTAITTLEIKSESSEVFNTVGQKISKAQRGINIVNGRKVLVK